VIRGSARGLVVLLGILGCGPAAGTEGPTEHGSGGPQLPRTGDTAAVEREALGEPQLLEMGGDSPVITIRVVFDAGSAEDGAHAGITNLTARLLVGGGTESLTYAELTSQLFPMAGELGAQVGRDETVFVGRVHRDHLAAFYALFRDVLLTPRMAEEDFRRVKTQVTSELELELRGNDDEELGKEMLQSMLYEGHPYGHPVLGTETGLRSIAVEDVRVHRQRVFCGGRATVGIAGGYPEGFAEQLRRDVATATWDSCMGRLRLPAAPSVDASRMWIVDKAEASATAISMGMHIDVTRADPDYPALLLASAYLGQHRQFAGILMQRMRGDRGLNYGDYAYAEHFDQDGWSVFPQVNTSRRQQYFSIWIRPVEPAKAQFAIRMAVRELRRFVERGMTAGDLERIRTFADGYYALYLQTQSRRLGFALDDRFYGLERSYLERLRESWRALTVEQINEAIRRHLRPDQLQIAVVAPDATRLADALASEAASPIEYAAEVSEEVQREDLAIVGYRVGIPRARIRVVPLSATFR